MPFDYELGARIVQTLKFDKSSSQLLVGIKPEESFWLRRGFTPELIVLLAPLVVAWFGDENGKRSDVL